MDWLSYGKEGHEAECPWPVVFLPGWGFRGGILRLTAPAHLWWSPAAVLHPETAIVEVDALRKDRHWRRIILVGWSLGARLALEYAVSNPTAIEALVLLSLRRQWPEEELDAIRAGLAVDPVGFMTDFYRKCFLGYRDAWQHFAAHHLASHLQNMDPSLLEEGLNCLARPLAPLFDALKGKGVEPDRLWLLHGSKDIIAPCKDRYIYQNGQHTVVRNAGHALFLAPAVQTLSFLPAGIG